MKIKGDGKGKFYKELNLDDPTLRLMRKYRKLVKSMKKDKCYNALPKKN